MFTIHVAGDTAQAEIGVELDGRAVASQKLTPTEGAFALDLRNNATCLRGSLVGRFGTAQNQSDILGDFVVSQNAASGPCSNDQIAFRGELAVWRWPAPVVRQQSTVWLTPELSVETTLQLTTQQNVIVKFITVGQVITAVTLAQGINSATLTQGFSVGTVRIAPGVQLRLQPSTEVQDGSVFLQGSFSSPDHQGIEYAGSIATWPYLPPPGKGRN